jgi:hypothetical protein
MKSQHAAEPAGEREEEAVLDVFCTAQDEALRVYLGGWAPSFLRACFGAEGEVFPAHLDFEDLEMYMSKRKAAYEKRVSHRGETVVTDELPQRRSRLRSRSLRPYDQRPTRAVRCRRFPGHAYLPLLSATSRTLPLEGKGHVTQSTRKRVRLASPCSGARREAEHALNPSGVWPATAAEDRLTPAAAHSAPVRLQSLAQLAPCSDVRTSVEAVLRPLYMRHAPCCDPCQCATEWSFGRPCLFLSLSRRLAQP